MFTNEIKEILEEICPFEEFDENTLLIEDAILDSFGLVALIDRIEEDLNIVIPEDEVTPENFSSINCISELLKRIS